MRLLFRTTKTRLICGRNGGKWLAVFLRQWVNCFKISFILSAHRIYLNYRTFVWSLNWCTIWYITWKGKEGVLGKRMRQFLYQFSWFNIYTKMCIVLLDFSVCMYRRNIKVRQCKSASAPVRIDSQCSIWKYGDIAKGICHKFILNVHHAKIN